MAVCNKDCLNCIYADCILDTVDAREAAQLSRELDMYANSRTRGQERQAAYWREYYQAHKDEITAERRQYNQTHKAAVAARRRKYYLAHKAEAAVYQREYYQAHKAEKEQPITKPIKMK